MNTKEKIIVDTFWNSFPVNSYKSLLGEGRRFLKSPALVKRRLNRTSSSLSFKSLSELPAPTNLFPFDFPSISGSSPSGKFNEFFEAKNKTKSFQECAKKPSF